MKNVFLVLITILLVACSKDSEGDSSAEVTITISDFSITMDENPINGQVIGTINASTNQGGLTFSITEESPSGAFSINSSTGELKVADASLFDYEVNPTISATVRAVNGAVNRTASIEIILTNLEEDNIYNGNVTLTSQKEVDDFGANNYTQINGWLKIDQPFSGSTIVDLSPLSSLSRVTNSLYIETISVNNLSGLENIIYVTDLYIRDNDKLQDITALQNLTKLNGDLLIANTNLNSLQGLHNISTINGHLVIYSNDNLTNLEGLESLVEVRRNVTIDSNENLASLEGINNLKSIAESQGSEIGYLTISANYSLTNLHHLSNLESFDGTLEILAMLNLTNLEGLENLTSLFGLNISQNSVHGPTSLNGLEGLNHIERFIYLRSCGNLQDISALQNVSSNGGNFDIRISETGLTNLGGLSVISGDVFLLSIRFNEFLANLDGLENISSISHEVLIENNPPLTNFCGLTNVAQNNGIIGDYDVNTNGYNPTIQDLIDGNCSL